MGKGGIPDRWEAYSPLGKQIPGTRFITFKVPLHNGLCRDLGEDERFTPDILLNMMETNELKLGQIIDLTNTKRYYRPHEFTSKDIKYKKIFTEGRVVPSSKVRRSFFKVVDDFLKNNEDDKTLVGVHCTHGLNRTGYLICRYMIDKLNFEPNDAIQAFNDARGYQMERDNYLEDLRLGKLPVSDGETVDADESADLDENTTHGGGDRKGMHQLFKSSSTENGDGDSSQFRNNNHRYRSRRNHERGTNHHRRNYGYDNGGHNHHDYRNRHSYNYSHNGGGGEGYNGYSSAAAPYHSNASESQQDQHQDGRDSRTNSYRQGYQAESYASYNYGGSYSRWNDQGCGSSGPNERGSGSSNWNQWEGSGYHHKQRTYSKHNRDSSNPYSKFNGQGSQNDSKFNRHESQTDSSSR